MVYANFETNFNISSVQIIECSFLREPHFFVAVISISCHELNSKANIPYIVGKIHKFSESLLYLLIMIASQTNSRGDLLMPVSSGVLRISA